MNTLEIWSKNKPSHFSQLYAKVYHNFLKAAETVWFWCFSNYLAIVNLKLFQISTINQI